MSHKESWDQVQVGEEITPKVFYVTQDHINAFQVFLGAGMAPVALTRTESGHNLHVDEEYSRAHMFGGNVGDGHQTYSYMCQLVTDWLPYGSLVSGYSEVDIKMTNPTRPGDRVVAKGVVKDKFVEFGKKYVVCEVNAFKAEEKMVAVGTIKAMVPDVKVRA